MGSVPLQATRPLDTNASAARVLVVDDAPEFRDIMSSALTSAGHEVHTANDGATALEMARELEPQLILLDLGLPGIDGVEVCRQLRLFTNAYIVMVTGRTEETDTLVGLAVGADDYITKPFSARELTARVGVLLRRPLNSEPNSAEEPNTHQQFGGLAIDLLAREVTLDGEPVELTRIEFELLTTLSERPEMVFTRELLLETVWDRDWGGDTHLVEAHIANLRKKIDRNGARHIKTVRGVGYRLAPQE